jgi:hypothetical protein
MADIMTFRNGPIKGKRRLVGDGSNVFASFAHAVNNSTLN